MIHGCIKSYWRWHSLALPTPIAMLSNCQKMLKLLLILKVSCPTRHSLFRFEKNAHTSLHVFHYANNIVSNYILFLCGMWRKKRTHTPHPCRLPNLGCQRWHADAQSHGYQMSCVCVCVCVCVFSLRVEILHYISCLQKACIHRLADCVFKVQKATEKASYNERNILYGDLVQVWKSLCTLSLLKDSS